jgi:hypothetical protein
MNSVLLIPCEYPLTLPESMPMYKAIGIAVVFVAAIGLASERAAAATKVYLLGGQSNMAGVGGYSTDLPCPTPYSLPQANPLFWNYGPDHVDQWGTNDPKTGDGWTPTQPQFGYKSDQFGPELSFGYKLHQAFPDDDIYLVKFAISGTTLAADWNPDGTGTCYNRFKSRVDAAIADLTAAGKSPTVAGMIWMQGESDAKNHDYALAYGTNLTNFIADVREDFDTPDMRFVLGRSTTYYGTAEDSALVRYAQEAIPLEVSNTACFATDDLQQAYGGHYGTQGQIDLGIRFADQFIQTPEPSLLVLALTGLLPLAGYLRWRRNLKR